MILPEGNKLATLILHPLLGSDLCTAEGRVITGSSVKSPCSVPGDGEKAKEMDGILREIKQH